MLRSILAKSEFDNCFGSPAAFPAALAGSPSTALPFSTFPAGTDCRWRERGSMESWVRPFPLLGKKGKQSNLFPVFITNIDLGIREEQLQTFCGRNILGNLRSVHLARHGVSRGPARPRLIYRVSARRVAYSNRDFVALHFYAVHFQHCLRGLGFICELNICQTLQSHTA